MHRYRLYGYAAISFFILVSFSGAFAHAQTATSTSTTPADIQAKIDANNASIQQLNTQIAQYQTQLTAVSAQKQTLQSTISQINLSIKKTTASISVTKSQINTTQLQIQQLQTGITSEQATIADEQDGLAQSIRYVAESDQQPLLAAILSSDGVSAAWEDIDDTETLQGAIDSDIAKLSANEKSLTDSKNTQVAKRSQLVTQQSTLTSQQGSLSATRDAQNELLTQTKSQESTFEALIAEKKNEEASFESALSDLKSQYNQAVNPNSITPAGAGILQWPIAGKITITQYFGNTPFADANSALYSGHGHDGLDIAAPIGTPVHAALTGTILATGNTDATKGCQGGSFGKWVMIKHANGLNTMYAHLSQIGVTPGQEVQTGDVIGFSGETGYATGPHLHFGVYVSSVTKIIPLGQATGGDAPCSKAIMPVPPVSGYLNPLNYLPAITFINDTGE